METADNGRPLLHGNTWERIEARLDRIEDKLDRRMTTLDAKVDGIASRQDRQDGQLQGSLGMIKWLGPAGLGAVLWALLRSFMGA